MAGYLQKVNPGDRLRIAARTYNAFVDAAKAQQMQSLGSQSGPRNDAPVVMLVQVKNVSGSDCPHFGVLGISGVVFDPVAAPDAFKDSVVFSGTTPSALSHAGGRFVICAEPIANGSIGAAWAGGICQVQIEVSNADHAYADVSNGLMTKLASVESGPCTILWKQSGTGTKWAIVRFGGGGGGTGGPHRRRPHCLCQDASHERQHYKVLPGCISIRARNRCLLPCLGLRRQHREFPRLVHAKCAGRGLPLGAADDS